MIRFIAGEAPTALARTRTEFSSVFDDAIPQLGSLTNINADAMQTRKAA
jgi:hypothetical protein